MDLVGDRLKLLLKSKPRLNITLRRRLLIENRTHCLPPLPGILKITLIMCLILVLPAGQFNKCPD